MINDFEGAFFDELVKQAGKGHSAGMLGALIGAGAGAIRGSQRGLFRRHGKGSTKSKALHALLNAGVAAPLGYVAGRGIYSTAKAIKGVGDTAVKHTKKLADSDEE